MAFPFSLKQKSVSLSSPSHPRRHLPPFTIVFFHLLPSPTTILILFLTFLFFLNPPNRVRSVPSFSCPSSRVSGEVGRFSDGFGAVSGGRRQEQGKIFVLVVLQLPFPSNFMFFFFCSFLLHGDFVQPREDRVPANYTAVVGGEDPPFVFELRKLVLCLL